MSVKDSVGYSAVKYIFFGLHVLVWILGASLLGLGIWLQGAKGPFISLTPTHTYLSLTVVCIAVSIVILLVGFLGCYGALMENQCILAGYFVFVILLFAAEVCCGALMFVYRQPIKKTLREEMLFSIRLHHDSGMTRNEVEILSSTWAGLQRKLKCCGVNNFTDWYRGTLFEDQQIVPDACCVDTLPECGKQQRSPLFRMGCLSEVEYWFVTNMYILGVVAITVGVVQILAIAAAILLFCSIRNNRFDM